jgi:hypothetical protein
VCFVSLRSGLRISAMQKAPASHLVFAAEANFA